ncbi:trypsin-like peptidase domain-containing protein [Microlunatus parietis]|uniref:Putative serine protease PepD n=1 Tax=Microlunatus parietis TaxID=682979 RepID=A0A7Y9I7D0_9ACTN|nr:trypsin-like peptidase domain-containing protein [Microlunatus parietis]NYE71651.1 putative serine protease PepD [Microlunatus parietis]
MDSHDKDGGAPGQPAQPWGPPQHDQGQAHELGRPHEQSQAHHPGRPSAPNQGPQPTHLNTPPFGYQPPGAPTPGPTTAADFPAPPGVSPVTTYAPKKARPKAAVVLVAAMLSAVIGAGAGIGSYAAATAGGAITSPIRVSTLPAADSPKLDGSITAAAEKISQSVVTINAQTRQGTVGGTGVVLDTEGHILTNDHVVSGVGQGGTVQVTLPDGRVVDAKVIGTSPNNDLAVIKVDGVEGLVPATFSSSSNVKVGQSVVAVGAPLGLSESVTSGIVSNTARPVRSGDTGEAVYLALQTDAAINHGNSGGPLVDLNGAVVGINSAIATGSNDSEAGSIGIGFAIPSDVATRVAAELIKEGRSVDASLGVTVAGVGSQQQAEDPNGVPLQSVAPGSAADRAGLQAGDQVTKINDIRITSADGLIAAIRFYAPGTSVEITYQRDGQTHTAQVTLGSAQ